MGSVHFVGIDALNDESRRSGFGFVQLGHGPAEARYRLSSLPRVHFSVSSFSQWMVGRGAPPPGVCLVAVRPGDPASVSPEGFALSEDCDYVAPGREFIRTLPAGRELVAVAVEHAALEQAAEARLGVSLSRIARHGVFSTRGAAARAALHAAVLRLAGEAHRLHVEAPHDDAQARRIESETFDALLDAALPDAHLRDRPDRQRLARRAAFRLHDAAESPATLAEVAAGLQTTLRTLETGFRETFGVSPRHFRHCVRMQRARDELRIARDGATVGAIATRHGLLHLGRFSVDYRKTFGESPAETLRRERAGRRLSA